MACCWVGGDSPGLNALGLVGGVRATALATDVALGLAAVRHARLAHRDVARVVTAAVQRLRRLLRTCVRRGHLQRRRSDATPSN